MPLDAAVRRSPIPAGGGPHPDYEVTALVLQGGGALGSYQAGVYEGLAQAGIQPNWVAGISIGALNSAVIAGNPPERRVECLREFWQFICRQPWWPPLPVTPSTEAPAELPQAWRVLIDSLESTRALLEGQNGFFLPPRGTCSPCRPRVRTRRASTTRARCGPRWSASPISTASIART